MVQLVVNEESGLVGVFLDQPAQATECAQARAGVIVELEPTQDFRPDAAQQSDV